MVTKIKILKAASFAGTTPWFLGLENHLQGLAGSQGWVSLASGIVTQTP